MTDVMPGTVVDWSVTSGSVVRKDESVGRVEIHSGGFTRVRMLARVPADGTVVDASVTDGTYVTSGTQLAVATDLTRVRVAARIEEAVLADDVQVGQRVDIVVDAFPRHPAHRHGAGDQRSTAAWLTRGGDAGGRGW